MKRSIFKTLVILLVVIVVAAFSRRSGKVSVTQRTTHVSFVKKYVNDFKFIKTNL